jgi:hypothetical protein
MEDAPGGDRELAGRVERLEAVAAVARRLVHHLSRLIEPDGREWKDYLALLDALEALRRPSGNATAPSDKD